MYIYREIQRTKGCFISTVGTLALRGDPSLVGNPVYWKGVCGIVVGAYGVRGRWPRNFRQRCYPSACFSFFLYSLSVREFFFRIYIYIREALTRDQKRAQRCLRSCVFQRLLDVTGAFNNPSVLSCFYPLGEIYRPIIIRR